jgi:hypothetical protein
MGLAFVLAAIVAAGGPISNDASSVSLFPARLFTEKQICGGRQVRPVLDAFRSAWYAKHLIAAGERPLPESTGREALRFLWLRSFHHPVVVRIDDLNRRSPRLHAVELSGRGGYGPGIPLRRLQRRLTPIDLGKVRSALATKPFSGDDPCEVGLDGAEWVFERAGQAQYSFARRSTPRSGNLYSLGTTLLDLTGWNFGERY